MFVDLIIRNARIATGDAASTTTSALAVLSGRIVAVGEATLDLKAKQVIDLGGRFVLPGMVDGYSHIMSSGLDLLPSGGKVNITRLTSIADILGAVAARAAEVPRGEWIATSCMFRGGLAEGRWPDRHDLDSVTPHHPAYIMQGGRPIIANSRALALAGIDRDTADPVDPAGRIVRDANGEPTGQLVAGAADLARRRWSPSLGIPPEEWDFQRSGETELIAALEAQQSLMHACGVTATRDVATMRREVTAFLTAHRQGRLQLRTQLLPIVPERYLRSDAEFASVFDSYFPMWQLGDATLNLGGVAIDYSLDGWRMMEREHLVRLICEGNRRGWTVAVTPGIGGEEEMDAVLDALEEAHRERPIAGRRFPVMHPMGLRRADQRARSRALGLTLNPNPLLNYFAAERSVKMFDAVSATGLLQSRAKTGLEQATAMWGLSTRDWVQAGLVVSAGSNTPAAVYDPERPFLGLYALATGDTSIGVLLADQALDRSDAIAAFTRNGAFVMGLENEIGTLEIGKLADFIVTDINLLECPDDTLCNAKVISTYFGGACVYER